MKNREENENKSKRKLVLMVISSIILIFIISSTWFYVQGARIKSATTQYNSLVAEYNTISQRYIESLKNCCIDNIEGAPEELGELNTEATDWRSIMGVLFGSNSRKKIVKDISTLQVWIEAAKGWEEIVNQITAPSNSWVSKRLKKVPFIIDTQWVTIKNNPDGLLSEEGGYKGCVYFTTNLVDPSNVAGKDIVAKGTDAGGAVEIYATAKEALERCDYLAQFDGTILYSGSYAAVGTMVIRTSYMLSGEDQLKLTDAIVEAFTR